MTVNEILSLCRAVRSRVNSLEGLRDKVSVETSYMESKEKVVKPQYDCRLVDRKITNLQKFLYEADSKVKQSNANTKIEGLNADVEKLLAPLE